MKIKGMDKFLSKIPAFSGFKLILLVVFVVLVIIINFTVLRFFGLSPALFPELGWMTLLFPILGVLMMESIGLILVYQMWAYRESFRKKYGALAYQKVFLFGFGGVAIILSIAVFNNVSFFLWQNSFWATTHLRILVIPLTSLISNFETFFNILGYIFSVFFILLGMLMVLRALQIFGFDYMAVIYLYFPEESKIQNHEIYSLLRHPTYSAAILMCLGGVFLQRNVYSILFFLIYYLGFCIHIHFVEEKELIQRFGDSYIIYRNNVPPFFVKPKNYYRFLKFILSRKT
jgi:protein-S-isoprenylcysteine O-methyltransferase Ste14